MLNISAQSWVIYFSSKLSNFDLVNTRYVKFIFKVDYINELHFIYLNFSKSIYERKK